MSIYQSNLTRLNKGFNAPIEGFYQLNKNYILRYPDNRTSKAEKAKPLSMIKCVTCFTDNKFEIKFTDTRWHLQAPSKKIQMKWVVEIAQVTGVNIEDRRSQSAAPTTQPPQPTQPTQPSQPSFLQPSQQNRIIKSMYHKSASSPDVHSKFRKLTQISPKKQPLTDYETPDDPETIKSPFKISSLTQLSIQSPTLPFCPEPQGNSNPDFELAYEEMSEAKSATKLPLPRSPRKEPTGPSYMEEVLPDDSVPESGPPDQLELGASMMESVPPLSPMEDEVTPLLSQLTLTENGQLENNYEISENDYLDMKATSTTSTTAELEPAATVPHKLSKSGSLDNLLEKKDLYSFLASSRELSEILSASCSANYTVSGKLFAQAEASHDPFLSGEEVKPGVNVPAIAGGGAADR